MFSSCFESIPFVSGTKRNDTPRKVVYIFLLNAWLGMNTYSKPTHQSTAEERSPDITEPEQRWEYLGENIQ